MIYKWIKGLYFNADKNKKAEIIKELENKENLDFVLIPMDEVAKSGRHMIYFISAKEFKEKNPELF